MFHFTIRDWLWLMVAVVLGATLFVTPSRREHDRQSIMRRPSQQELEAVTARYQAAKGEFECSHSFYGRPPSIESVCNVIERLAHAIEELSDDPAFRVKELARALGFAQQLASIALDKYENEVEPAKAVYRVQYTRADIEARLRRAEQDLAAGQGTR